MPHMHDSEVLHPAGDKRSGARRDSTQETTSSCQYEINHDEFANTECSDWIKDILGGYVNGMCCIYQETGPIRVGLKAEYFEMILRSKLID